MQELQDALDELVALEEIIGTAIALEDDNSPDHAITPREVAQWLQQAIYLFLQVQKGTRP